MITRIIMASIALLSLLPAAPCTRAQSVDTAVAAQESQTPKDVDIEADQMEVLDKESRAIFRGHVIATRGSTTLKCDTLIVSWDTALSSSQLADYSACVVLLARKGTILFSTLYGPVWNIPILGASYLSSTIAGAPLLRTTFC